MIATLRPPQRTTQFPEADVEAALRKFWTEEARQRSDDPLAPPPKMAGTPYDLLPEMGSLTVVRSFVIIKNVLGMEVPVCLVRPGGYFSQTEMLNDLLPKFRKLYETKKNMEPK